MMVVGNDFFIGNDDAKAHDFSNSADRGNISFLVRGVCDGYDAGTVVIDFICSLANGPFGFGGAQTATKQGTDGHGAIQVVGGNACASFLNQALVPAGHQWGGLTRVFGLARRRHQSSV